MMDERFEYLWMAFMVAGAIPLGALMIVPILVIFSKRSSIYWVAAVLAYVSASIMLASFNLLLFFAILGSIVLVKRKNIVLLIGLMGLAALATFISTPVSPVFIAFFVVGVTLLTIQHPELVDYLYGKSAAPKRSAEDPYLKKLDLLATDLERLKHEDKYR